MKNKRNIFFPFLIFIAGIFVCRPLAAQESFLDYCLNSYVTKDICPEKTCEMKCPAAQANDPACVKGCLPKECPQIKADDCPLDYCTVMTDCSEEKICHYKMIGGKPQCGTLAYAGQDVECCKGLVKRCGIEFLDGRCDMAGKNSIYNLPICIPCGDGVCSQFEDSCNCPEDCRKNYEKPAPKIQKDVSEEKDKESKPASEQNMEFRGWKIIEISPKKK